MRDLQIGDVEVFVSASPVDDIDNLIDGPWAVRTEPREDATAWWICDSGALVCELHAHEVPRREREPLDPELAGLLEEHEHGCLLICSECEDAGEQYAEFVHAVTRTLADAFADGAYASEGA